MGFFDAFLRGVAGPGFSQLSRDNIRAAELEQQRAETAAAREDNQKFREQQAALERAARMELLQEKLGGGSGGGAGGGGGGGKRGGGILDMATVADIGLGAEYSMSGPESRQAQEAARTGVNTYTKPGQVSEQYDEGDGRMRNVTRDTQVPDEDKFREMVKRVNRVLRTDAGGAEPQETALARQRQAEIDAAARAGKGDVAAVREGLALKGHAPVSPTGSDLATGAPRPGSEAASKVTENFAQAGRAGAAADKDRNDIASNPRDLTLLEKAKNNAEAKYQEARAKVTLAATDIGKSTAEQERIKDSIPNVAELKTIRDTATQQWEKAIGRHLAGKEPKAAPADAKATKAAQAEQALADAKRVIASRPDMRAEVLRRLKAAGIDAKGL